MQIMKGSKREITIMEHTELLEKHIKRLNDSMECFRRFKDVDSLERLIEDCNKLTERATCTKEVIELMNQIGM